jgi:uncharacterized low-complexity protein
MKRTAKFLILFGLPFSLLFAQVAYAEVSVQVSSSNESSSNVSVQSESSGTTTVCQNGKCTTTGGDSKSTVCVNGKCTTTGEDVNYEDGNTRIRINNNETNVQVGPTASDENKVTPTDIPEPTITVNPTITKEIEDAQKESEAIQERIKARVKEQESAIETFIKAEMENLQKLLNSIFS